MKKYFLLIALMFVASFSFAQDVKILDLYQAINIAKDNNSTLKIASLEKKKASLIVSEVYSENLVPSLTLTSGYTRAFKKPSFTIFGEQFSVGSDNSISTSIQATESLPILGTPVFSGIRIAEYYSKLQDEIYYQNELIVKSNVKKAYYGVLLAKQVNLLNSQTLQNSEENFNVVDKRYKNGVTTEFDYLRAKVNVNNIRPNVLNSENNLSLAKNNLKNVTGLSVDQQIDVVGELTYDSSEVFGSMESLINKITENNVLIRQLSINRDINKEFVKINEANFLPKFQLFGNYTLEANEDDGERLTNYKFNNSISAGIRLSWDLNLFKNSYKVQQSEIEIKKNDEQLNELKRNLKLQSESVYIRIQDARNRIRSQYETVKLAERGYELANLSYRNGVITQIDVLDSQLLLSQTKLSYLNAIYDFLIARTDLELLLEK
ncbi:MAG TPA: TolC family protein [Ignavibacteria bacterium]|nr:TolC family protein [Ignavibacteria bacterium]